MSLFSHSVYQPPSRPKVDLRWYQQEALDAIHREFGSVRSTGVVLATGLGKTVIFSALATGWPGKVLVLAHRDELVDQAKRSLENVSGGEWVMKEKAHLRASDSTRLVVGSVQTLCSDTRLKRFKPDHFSLIIVDEVHHATSPSYRKILDYFAGAKVLGVTATPDRGDGTALGLVLESIAYKMDIRDGIDAGYLVPIAGGFGHRVYLDEINLEDVHIQSGDLAVAQLDKAMLRACEGIVRKTVEICGNRQSIGFLPGVKSAEYANEKCNVLRPGSSIMISGKTEEDERARLVRDFRKGHYQFLWNCAIATEGFDAPGVSCIALGRPTKSRALYAQMVGRGTRVLPGVVDELAFADGKEDHPIRREAIANSKKPDLMLLDFVGNSGKHTLACAEDLLGGDYTDEEKALAKKKVRDGERNVRDALERARTELKKLAAAQKAQVKARVERFDPFRLVGLNDMDQYAVQAGHKPMLPSHREKLLQFGYPEQLLDSLDRAGGERLIKTAYQRIRDGLATFKQLNLLRRFGVNDPTLTKERASAGITYITQARSGPNPGTLNQILYGLRQPGQEG